MAPKQITGAAAASHGPATGKAKPQAKPPSRAKASPELTAQQAAQQAYTEGCSCASVHDGQEVRCRDYASAGTVISAAAPVRLFYCVANAPQGQRDPEIQKLLAEIFKR